MILYWTSLILLCTSDLSRGHNHADGISGQNDVEEVIAEPLPVDPAELQKKIRDVWDSYKDNKYLDREHLADHVGNMMSLSQQKQLTSDELAFYFHGLHDFNNDNNLDGLELMYALKHSLSHQNPQFEQASLEAFAPLIDNELAYMDKDMNGMISFAELRGHLQYIQQLNQAAAGTAGATGGGAFAPRPGSAPGPPPLQPVG